jgi:hypothetical protein
MNQNVSRTRRRSSRPMVPPPMLSEADLAKLGDGKVAYIKTMTSAEAKEAFPAIEGLPSGINLYALHGADGTPLALTDSKQAAIGHALGDELEVQYLN